MTTFTMPYGYNGVIVTEEELKRKATFRNLHPEVQRRFLALSKYLWLHGVSLGVGTGWRVQPTDKPGFAAPGNSWHEGVPVESGENALAIDTVPSESWKYMENILYKFGFRSFRKVNEEPWHIQPIEIPTSRNFATELPPLGVWDFGDFEYPPYVAPMEEISMLGLDLGKPGVDTWWTRMTYTGTQLTHVKSPADQLQHRAGIPIQPILEPELDALLDNVTTVGPSPFVAGGQAPNANLHAKWEKARGRV